MSSGSGFRLGVKCCFCGGSLIIDEASRTTECSHCGSILKVVRDKSVPKYFIEDDLSRREVKFLIDRHLKKNGQPLVSSWLELSKVYLPFWRMTGTVFSIQVLSDSTMYNLRGYQQEPVEQLPEAEVKILAKEVTLCADDTFNWGLESLGIRTQVLQLTPLETDFCQSNHLINPSITLEQARQRFDDAANSTAIAVAQPGSDVDLTTVGVEGMIIYFPLWLAVFTNSNGKQQAQFDPLAKRVVSLTAEQTDIPSYTNGFTNDAISIRIMPHRCPNCGVDLPANEHSETYYCANCRRLYIETADGYSKVRLQVPDNVEPEHKLFPFWVFDLSSSDWTGKPQFFKALSLVGCGHDHFYVPAFEVVNPARLLRLVSHYNKRNDVFTFKQSLNILYTFVDVTLSPELAAALIIPLTAALKALKGYKSYEAPLKEDVNIGGPALVWLPFVLDRYFWREQLTGTAIEKAAVRCC